ncbi:hypothetical protein IWW38_003352 [Coemansia aciculifera]|uniref:Uncharacterized protein n=1 Tax=Coemansia aciculifera TaxID=417176 RepID=A0ACC1M1Z6_9FUNG|nr:hypothetical protein IWW38_003352 [Coemansia aciculifera]
MLDNLNDRRKEDNRPPLTLNEALNNVSQSHSDYQASGKTMTHDDTQGSLGKRVSDAGIKWSRIGENVASGAETVDRVMDQWKHSPGHLANILGDYTIVGFGLATDGPGTKGNTYWTQTFVKTT